MEPATSFVKIEIRNRVLTLFWYDVWSPLGRLIDLTENRNCIDLGIELHFLVEKVLSTNRRRRYRTEILNRIEDAIEKQRDHGVSQEEDGHVKTKRAQIQTKIRIEVDMEADP